MANDSQDPSNLIGFGCLPGQRPAAMAIASPQASRVITRASMTPHHGGLAGSRSWGSRSCGRGRRRRG